MTNNSSRRHLTDSYWAIFICAFASFFYVYDYFIQVSPSIMTHALMEAFDIDAAGLAVLGSCFYYAYLGMQIPAGLLLDRFGARKLLSFAVLMSGLGVLLFAQSHSFWLAGLARLLIGFGSAFSFVSALYLIANWFSHRYFASLSGVVQFGACAGSIFGLAPLSMAVNYYGWRETLTLIGILTFVLAGIYWFVIRDGHTSITKVQRDLPTSQWVRLRSLLGCSQLWWVSIVGFCSWVPVATFGALWGVPYLMCAYHLTNTAAGGWCTVFWLALGIGSPILGWFSDNINRRKLPFYLCFSVGLLGGILLVQAPTVGLPWAVLGLTMVGFSASIQSLTFGVVKDILPATVFATASGFVNMAAIIGGALSQLAFGYILTFVGTEMRIDGVIQYAVENYQTAMLLLPISAIFGLFVTSVFMKETFCQQQIKFETILE